MMTGLMSSRNLVCKVLGILLLGSPVSIAQPSNTVNLLFLGDSLTEGVPHINGETETYPYMTAEQLPGSTYVKLGYRGQSTDYLLTHLDTFLFGLLKNDYQRNVLVVWGGTNDCALGVLDCAQPAYTRLVLIARTARAAGWKVVAVTMIARASWFLDDQHQQQFTLNQATLNSLLLASTEFDAVADPSLVLNDPTNYTYYCDGTHMWAKGYRVVANLVAQAIRSLP